MSYDTSAILSILKGKKMNSETKHLLSVSGYSAKEIEEIEKDELSRAERCVGGAYEGEVEKELDMRIGSGSLQWAIDDIPGLKDSIAEFLKDPVSADKELSLFSVLHNPNPDKGYKYALIFLHNTFYEIFPEVWCTAFVYPFLSNAPVEIRMFALEEFRDAIYSAINSRYSDESTRSIFKKSCEFLRKKFKANPQVFNALLLAFDEKSRPDIVKNFGHSMSGHGYANNTVIVLRHLAFNKRIPKPKQKKYVWCHRCGAGFDRKKMISEISANPEKNQEYFTCNNCDWEVGIDEYW